MKKIIILIFFTVNYPVNFSQIIPIVDFIKEAKECTVPIECSIDRDSVIEKNYGTAVLLIHPDGFIMALTCEHVVAIKDSLYHTIDYYPTINLILNPKDTSEQNVKIKAEVIIKNEIDDYAVLFITKTGLDTSIWNKLYMKTVPQSLWKNSNDLQEGETVLYVGYPMRIGINKINHPLSRTGIISQIIPGNESFLIDGFVQHGHSGSPVFLIRPEVEENKWSLYLIGIATSYPPEFGDIYEKVDYKKDADKKTILNPGFTYVLTMDKIIDDINNIFKPKMYEVIIEH
jgi:hypothetical protein